MAIEYLTPDEARELPGLRLALTRGVPGPYSMSARAVFDLRDVPFVAVEQIPAAATAARRPGTPKPVRALATLLVLALLDATAFAATAAKVKGRVADLAWMSGAWIGPFGDRTLEEHWLPPANGTLACLVRITGEDTTEMLELILIEDAADSLVFRVRQWFPGFVPRRPEPQVMKLRAIGENRVSFSGEGDVDFRTLTYSRPGPDEFHIDAETMAGELLQLRLRAR